MAETTSWATDQAFLQEHAEKAEMRGGCSALSAASCKNPALGGRPWLGLLALVASFAGPAAPAAEDTTKTRQLVAVIQSSASLAERARACQQLAIVGSAEAVPALAALLADEKLGNYARDALEVMPDPAAVDALRAALGRLQGRLLIGVVNSLGARRDTKAVDALSRIAREANSVAAVPALLALGQIGTVEATRVLQQVLTSGAPDRRTAAAEGCLTSADQFLQAGDRPAAIALYDFVRRANPPGPLRVTATRGAILARETAGLPLLLENLTSSDPDLRDMAVLTTRELRGSTVGSALVAELERLPPAIQLLLIPALVERGEKSAVSAIENFARTDNHPAQVTAVEALGKMGRASSLPILFRAMNGPAGAANDAAAAAFARITVPETDAFLLKTLPTVGPDLRVRLITLLGERKSGGAVDELLKFAAGPDAESSKAAFRALALVAVPDDLPRLIPLAAATSDEATKVLADRAIVTTTMKIIEPERRADDVLAAFREATDAKVKTELLRPLGAIVRAMGGSHEVFFDVQAALAHPAEAVRVAALQCLADWPDAAPTTTLLAWAGRDVPEAQREVALRGAMRMAGAVAAGRERSPLDVVGAFTRANRIVRTRDEKMMMVSALGSLKHPQALDLLEPYLNDPDVQAEAALALVQVAPALGGEKAPPKLKPLLERVAANDKDEDVRRRAGRFAKGGPAQPAKTKAGAQAARAAPPVDEPGVLFNGRDLGNWDGDPGVWRVRDGVIVGGSLVGNPRNEFLATTRSFRNFVLRLEYRLVGTTGFVNGGVQFGSVRIAQPPNEMSGYQADIGAGHSGSLYDESRRKKFLARATEEQIKRLEKPGDWNRYEIRCEGARVTLSLNGEQTLTYTEEDATVAADGLIALQIHGNCKAEISFRNVRIEELP